MARGLPVRASTLTPFGAEAGCGAPVCAVPWAGMAEVGSARTHNVPPGICTVMGPPCVRSPSAHAHARCPTQKKAPKPYAPGLFEYSRLSVNCRLALAELGRTAGSLEAVFKSSEWRFPLIFQGFSGYSTKIAPPFNHKNGGTLSTHGRGKCGIYNAQKVFGLIILHLRIDVHSCLAVFMPRKILNCLWINASIQKIGNVGMP